MCGTAKAAQVCCTRRSMRRKFVVCLCLCLRLCLCLCLVLDACAYICGCLIVCLCILSEWAGARVCFVWLYGWFDRFS